MDEGSTPSSSTRNVNYSKESFPSGENHSFEEQKWGCIGFDRLIRDKIGHTNINGNVNETEFGCLVINRKSKIEDSRFWIFFILKIGFSKKQLYICSIFNI